MRYLPNTITAFRVLCALLLLLFEPMSAGFLITHAFGSLSDAADGYLARKYQLQTSRGAIFDSIADALYVLVLLVVMIPYLEWPGWIVAWIAAIVVVRLVAVSLGFARFHALVFLHTYANKVTGAVILAVPFFVLIFDPIPVMFAVCCLATISAVEELLIIAFASELDRDVTSIFAQDQLAGD